MHFIRCLVRHNIAILFILLGYSLITLNFPDNQEKFLGYSEVAIGLGLMVGPALSSLIYDFVGYMYTFIIFGCLLLFSVLPILIFIPKEHSSGLDEADSSTALKAKNRKLPYSVFFKNRAVMLTLLACTAQSLFLYFIDSIYSIYLEDTFNIDSNLIGYVYMIPLFVYILACPLVSKLSMKFENRVFIIMGFIIQIFALFLSGPSDKLHIPK